MPVALPAGVRPPLAIPLQRTADPVFGTVAYGTGSARRRRLRRASREAAQLQWRLPMDQMAAWNDWFEDDLQAGALEFIVPLQARDSVPSLHDAWATFSEPPRITVASGWATITADVVIRYPGDVVAAGLPPSNEASGQIPIPTPAGAIVWARTGATPGGVTWNATARTTWETHVRAAGAWETQPYPNVVLGGATITVDTPNFRQWTLAYTSNGTPATLNISSDRLQWSGTAWTDPA